MMLPSRHYVSEITEFIRKLKSDRPELEREQQQGRAIWWDKPPRDLAERRKMEQGKVPQPGYVYQSDD